MTRSEYAGILRLRGLKKKIAGILCALILASVFSGVLLYEPITHDEIVFVDVGQGACTHIRSGTADVMIDGGGNRDRNLGKNTLKPYLLKNGARDLDLALTTHSDMDHLKGLEELNECFKVKNFIQDPLKGAAFKISDDIYIETLWPPEKTQETGSENAGSSVFMIHYGAVRVLVMGDLDKEGERAMIAYYKGTGDPDRLKADVLNVGHHGSKTSTGKVLLEAVSPKIAVIQVGRNNYGHPSREVLKKLDERGIMVFRNDLRGAVGIDIEGRGSSARIKAVHVMKKEE